ncbi:MAG: hypothetical protein L6R42_007360 [Xanthoria sp. 1 TBL-2021]|nr:MAG: hypothetical protein L6R42_007360 [Xanthoria sp. 1 TBL-2021]
MTRASLNQLISTHDPGNMITFGTQLGSLLDSAADWTSAGSSSPGLLTPSSHPSDTYSVLMGAQTTPSALSTGHFTLGTGQPLIARAGKFWCPLCPAQSRGFRTVNALGNHLASPAHAPKIFHCPINLTSSEERGKQTEEMIKDFSTLSGLTQHVESESSDDFEYVETPAAPTPVPPAEDFGVRTTAYPAIKNAPLPADASGSDSFSNTLLIVLIFGVPWLLARKVGGGLFTTAFIALFTSIPILTSFWYIASSISPRKNEKARYPGRPVEHYLEFHDEKDRSRYYGKNKIPMETFHEMYFDGKVDFKGDALEIMEYRHDWANWKFTISLCRYFLTGMIPEVIMHTRSQGRAFYLCSRCLANPARRGASTGSLRPGR